MNILISASRGRGLASMIMQGSPFLKIITCPTPRILKFFDLLIRNKEEKSVQIHLPNWYFYLPRAVRHRETASPDDKRLQMYPQVLHLELTGRAIARIPPPGCSNNKTHVYIMAGIPDINDKHTSQNRHYRYTECTYTEHSNDTITRLNKAFREWQHPSALKSVNE